MTSAVGPSAPAKLSLEEKLAAFEAETRESAAAARSSVRSEPTQAETAADAGARVLALLYDYIHKRKLKVMDIFKRIDKDGSGTLTLEEFRTACAMLGFEMPETGEAPTDSQLVHAFECLDSDGGGEIEAAEFLDNLMQQKRLFQAGRCTDEQEGGGGIRAPPVVRRKPSPKECAEVRRLFQRVQSAGMELSEAITPQVLNVLSRWSSQVELFHFLPVPKRREILQGGEPLVVGPRGIIMAVKDSAAGVAMIFSGRAAIQLPVHGRLPSKAGRVTKQLSSKQQRSPASHKKARAAPKA